MGSLDVVRRAYEIGLVLLFLVVAARSWSIRGRRITVREVVFGFLLSQCVELLAVGLGRYRYPAWLAYAPPSPRWVPLGVGLGWAALVPCVMRVSERVLGAGASIAKLAALDGAMAVGLDLVLDPAVSGEPLRLWVWRGTGMTAYRYWLLGVPVFNFVGWFLLVGACSFQLRAAESRPAASSRRRWLAIAVAADLVIAYLVMLLPW